MTPESTAKKGKAVGKHRVRTSFTPGVVLHVDDAEYLDLTRQGLLLDDEKVAKLDAADEAAAAKAEADEADADKPEAPASSARKTKGA